MGGHGDVLTIDKFHNDSTFTEEGKLANKVCYVSCTLYQKKIYILGTWCHEL